MSVTYIICTSLAIWFAYIIGTYVATKDSETKYANDLKTLLKSIEKIEIEHKTHKKSIESTLNGSFPIFASGIGRLNGLVEKLEDKVYRDGKSRFDLV